MNSGFSSSAKSPQAPGKAMLDAQFSVFEYLYRDAGNYKAWGRLLLLGDVADTDIEAIRRALDLGEYFVPEQVGIPPLQGELYQYSAGPTEDDHAFHEFVDLRPARKSEADTLPLWGTVESLKARFQAAQNQTKEHLSAKSG